ncbi:MAG: ion channel [Methylocystis sp.]|uniref:ion channel n=1 Tax=Methylocystis sp. TaxID=1911079 RepID=UPI003DA30E1C
MIFNLIFAALYAMGERPIANAAPGDFGALFFFSVETMGTVGYGDMHPQTDYAHLIASAEIFTGACSLAVVTGVIFARFSRPRARLVFAANPVIAPHDGARTLMLRVANARRNMINNASAKLWVVRDERTAEGSIFRRFHRLRLERDDNPVFIYTWTIMHVIDDTSPLYGGHIDDLVTSGTSFVVTVSGLDETSSEFLQARKGYQARQVLFGHDYVDIVQRDTGSSTWIDYSKFHLTREVGDSFSSEA